MSGVGREFRPVAEEDARKVPVRLAEVQQDVGFAVEDHDEPKVMTVPHLLIREGIAFLALSLVLVVLSLVFDAPLEEMANPDVTPNPAKAPWYFLGLQELLHYYPPFVAGVLLPTLLIVALAAIPYFDVNLERKALWSQPQPARGAVILVVTVALVLVLVATAKYAIWPLIVPTILCGLAMAVPGFVGARGPVTGWLARRSVPFWIFAWFLVVAVVLTVIGTLFRGPGWTFTLPWRDGIY